MRKVKVISSIVILLVLVLGVVIALNFTSLAKGAAEKIASDALGVKVTISDLNVSLKEKNVVLSGLKIANPSGYKKSHIITADKMDIALNTASKELIDFKFVSVDGAVVNLEVNGTGVNLQDLKNLMQQKKQKESIGAKQVQVIVRKMVINTSTLKPSVSFMDKNLPSIEIKPISISGLGTGSNGRPAQQAVEQVMSILIAEAQKSATQAGYLSTDGVVDQLKGAVGNAAKDFKKLFE
ncbi:MAG: hypothetical protein R3D88_02060 [Alphaproteobacteria bacterium]|nr:hypothetical protein [Alphaproteobacteria bacterium]